MLRPIKTIFFFCLLIGASASAYSQDVYDYIDQKTAEYNRNGHQDSTALLYENYKEKWTQEEAWDSLVWVYENIAKGLHSTSSIEDVYAVVNEAKIIAEDKLPPEHERYLRLLLFKIRIDQEVGEVAKATEHTNYVLENSIKGGDTLETYYTARVSEGWTAIQQGQVDKTLALDGAVYEEVLKTSDTTLILDIIGQLQLVYNYLGDFEKSEFYVNDYVDIILKKFGPNHVNYGIALERVATILENKGEYADAYKINNQSMDIYWKHYSETGMTRMVSHALSNKAITLMTLEEYRLAYEHAIQALKMKEEEFGVNTYPTFFATRVALEAAMYRKDTINATRYLRKARQILDATEEDTELDLINLLSAEGDVEAVKENYHKAIRLNKKILEFYKNNPDQGAFRELISPHTVISLSYSKMDDFANAMKWSKEAMDLADKYFERSHDENILIRNNHMEFMVNAKKVDTAFMENTYKELLEKRCNGSFATCIPSANLINFSAIWATYLVGLDGKNVGPRYFEFLEDFEKYLDIHLSNVKSNSSMSSITYFLNNIYGPAIKYYMDKDPEKALEYIEKIKSLYTRLQLQSYLVDDKEMPSVNTDKIIEEFSTDTSQVNAFLQVASALDSLQAYKSDLSSSDPLKYAKYYGLKKFETAEIKKALHEGELLINIIDINDVLHIVYLSAQESRADTMSITSDDITEVSQIFDNDILSRYDKLLIVSDPALNGLNIETLKTPEGDYLIKTHTVRYATSAQVLGYQDQLQKANTNKNLLIGLTPGFTQDLKSKVSSSEIQQDSAWLYYLKQPFLLSLSDKLKSIFRSSENLIESDATESAFNEKATDYRILHLATHGVLDHTSPLHSKLIFAKDSLQDGYLHTYEIFGQEIDADLAVLSACSTGKENIQGYDGVLSLSQAFTHAGCPSILMTLWDVDEKSTAQILENFYEELKKGKKKSVALRDAKLQFLKTAPSTLKDPYYWGGLVLIGNDSPVISNNNMLWYLLGLGFFLLLVYFLVKKLRNR